MVVLVTGGRDYDNAQVLFETLDGVHAARPISLLVEGGARGADQLARQWARARGVASQTYRANWRRGPSAGPERNQRMLDESRPALVVAFPGGRGTADMCSRARSANVYIHVVK